MITNFSIFNDKGILLYGKNVIESDNSELIKLIHDKYTIIAQYKDLNNDLAREILLRFTKYIDLTLLEKNFNRFLEQIENSYGLICNENEKIGDEVKIDVIEKLYCIMNEKGRIYKCDIQGEILINGVKNKTLIVIDKPKRKMIYCSDLVCRESINEIKAELEFSGHKCPFRYYVSVEPPFRIIKISVNRYVLDARDSNVKNIELKIPFSKNAKNVIPRVYYGTVEVSKEYVLWKIPEIKFKKTYIDIKCDYYEDSERCIIAKFNTEFYSGSGINISNVSNGKKQPVWVRNQYTSGNFEIRRVYP
ncbi:hypothetical protein DMUE_3136 [Dictyocoela muelleri]|nr:hypothetical protein DMUE_3136 [Dictyocoela muelleri]